MITARQNNNRIRVKTAFYVGLPLAMVAFYKHTQVKAMTSLVRMMIEQTEN